MEEKSGKKTKMKEADESPGKMKGQSLRLEPVSFNDMNYLTLYISIPDYNCPCPKKWGSTPNGGEYTKGSVSQAHRPGKNCSIKCEMSLFLCITAIWAH